MPVTPKYSTYQDSAAPPAAVTHGPLAASHGSWSAGPLLCDAGDPTQGESATYYQTPVGDADVGADYPVVRGLYDLGASPAPVTRLEWVCLLANDAAPPNQYPPGTAKKMYCYGSDDGAAWALLYSAAETALTHGHRVVRGVWGYRYYQLVTWGATTYQFIADFRVYHADGKDASADDWTNPIFDGSAPVAVAWVAVAGVGGSPASGVLNDSGVRQGGWTVTGDTPETVTVHAGPPYRPSARHWVMFLQPDPSGAGDRRVAYFDVAAAGTPPTRRAVCG